jgi:Ca2+-binding RTX toxin-like protein
MSGTISNGGTLSITGSVKKSLNVTDASLASNFGPVSVTVGGATYTGASVYSIASAAGLVYPSSVKNGQLLDYLQVTGASGSQVVLSEGEIDPSFGGASSTDIIAYSENGASIAPTLIVPSDQGTDVRSTQDVLNITVGTATVPSSAVSSASPAPLTVSGAVSTPQTDSLAQVEALGTITQTDTFLQGTTPMTYTFTGASLASVLQAAGPTSSNLLDSYVVAAGSDGYAVVYSGGEIENGTILVAYNDGTGTFPSVGGVAGAYRTTAPADSKGGRYVSILDTLALDTAAASSSIAGFTPGLSGLNAAATTVVNNILASLTPAGTTPDGSVVSAGGTLAPSVSGALNIGVINPLTSGTTTTVPGGYGAVFLQSGVSGSLVDTSVGHALLVGAGADTLSDTVGSDTLVAGASATLFGGAAGDVLVGDGGTNTLVFGAAGGTAVTQTSNNRIFLGGGSTQVYSAGADTIVGSSGSATVFASAGALAYAGAGAMTLVNGSNASTLVGGAGHETVFGGTGGGLAFAGQGGGSALVAGSGAATLVGAASGDALFAGNTVSDLLVAGAGNETLSGLGSTGQAIFFAGSGNDLLLAGSGSDVFAFINGAAGGNDTIIGFNPATDVIALHQYTAAPVIAQTAGSTLLSLSDGTRILLQGVANISSASLVG